MNDLQKQTQEILNKLLMGRLVKHDEAKALLRKFVEECCRLKCLWCERGVNLVLDEGNGPGDEIYMHELVQGKKETRVECDVDEIHCHFAWLLEAKGDTPEFLGPR